MADRETSFISRWSRRKRDPDKKDDPAAEPVELAETSATDPASGEESDEGDPGGDPEVVAKLPDIESLDEASDFAPFMAKGVPEVLRRRALRKLWRLNPLFANLDGLNDYDEDFTDAANLLSEIKTVYKVGKGMVDKEATEITADETAEGLGGAEGSGQEEPAEPQLAESPAEVPAVEQPDSDLAAEASESDDKDQPVPVAESLPRTAEEGEAGEAVPRKPADPPRRSAAARRWGESSE